MIYAGIGSRKTPSNTLYLMKLIAHCLSNRGFILRSGGAHGADKAFEIGARVSTIFTAEHARNHPEWIDHAAQFHPAWGRCSGFAQLLHARNSAIILGANLDTPVDFVVCWTPDGKASGGTGQALRIAQHHGIPIFNLYGDPEGKKLTSWLVEKGLW